MAVRGRLAPSPTGALHLGNARTFLLAWLSVRSQGGTLILRVEDLDGPRVKPEATAAMLHDLRWLGLDWDEGPDVGGPFRPYLQTERVALYDAALQRLRTSRLVYPCVCTRSDIQAAASAPHAGEEGPRYLGTCRDRFVDGAEAERQSGRAPAWRLRVPAGSISFDDGVHGLMSIDVDQQVGDFVVQKNSGTAAYQLSVVVDDEAMNVSEVVRGDDLLGSTPRQILLQRFLGYQTPRYYHAPLVIGPDGKRLAKRHGDTRISAFREAGVSSRRLVGLLANWSGLAAENELVAPGDLVSRFDWSLIPHAPIVCDREMAFARLK